LKYLQTQGEKRYEPGQVTPKRSGFLKNLTFLVYGQYGQLSLLCHSTMNNKTLHTSMIPFAFRQFGKGDLFF
jgi:hypothetical protein